jgi:hypothetical protein
LSIGVTDEVDRLGGGDHDGGQGEELDEFVRVADDGLELGVAQHSMKLVEQGWARDDLEATGQRGVQHDPRRAAPPKS